MICLLTDIPFDALLTLLSYCEPLTILLGISRLSHHMRVVCLSSDALWKEQCHHVAIYPLVLLSSWEFHKSSLRRFPGSAITNITRFICYELPRTSDQSESDVEC